MPDKATAPHTRTLLLFITIVVIALITAALSGTLVYKFKWVIVTLVLLFGVFAYAGIVSADERDDWVAYYHNPLVRGLSLREYFAIAVNQMSFVFIVILFSAIASLVVVATFGLAELATKFSFAVYSGIISTIPGGQFTFIGTSAIFALSLDIYFFRFYCRSLFGLAEASIGLLIIAYRLSEHSTINTAIDTNFLIAILTAGVFLIIRGLDNIHQGRESDFAMKYIHR